MTAIATCPRPVLRLAVRCIFLHCLVACADLCVRWDQSQADTANGPRAKPNIVFILADDLGWTDLGCQGSRFYESPNIDRMAAQGLRFMSGYTCGPNCQPTRAALMTGQYGPRTGVYTVGGIERFRWQTRPLRPVDNVQKLPLDKVTIADSLKRAGYVTGMFGKWHLGEDPQHHPSQRGFDEAIVSMGKHFDFNTNPKTDYPAGMYLADFLTENAVNFIRRHKDEPFFLYLPHFGVHAPHEAKPELVAKFASKDKPAAGGHDDATYAAMIASVDESVGRVLATLDELKLSDDTLVIFSSDNGGVGGYVRERIKRAGDVTDNAPLRSGKGSLYEGGVRVPFIFRWPGKVPAGTTSDVPIISVDLFPTLMELAGGSAPVDQPLDGASLVSCLTSGGQTPPPRDALYWHFPGYLGAGQGKWRTTPAGAIRIGDFKLIEFFEDNRLELYNLKDDLSEQTNLASKLPDKAKELHGKLVAWRTEINAPMPTPNNSIEAADAAGGRADEGKAQTAPERSAEYRAAVEARWPAAQANKWLDQRGWLVGCNYIPSSAINQLEMWQADTFDAETIDRELGWAASLGFSSIRVFLHHLLWEQDSAGFLKRINKFVEIADRHRIGVMLVLFDSVWDPHPKLGRQREPKPGLHNSGWVQSPGADVLADRSRHDSLKPYVVGVVGHFRDDRRVQVWDVWNEPNNTNDNSYGKQEPPDKPALVRPLLVKAFAWAREARPTQPLTAGVWQGTWPDPDKLRPMERLQLDLSDVISFHNYGRLDDLKQCVSNLRRYDRPLLCTEYMARPAGSTFEPHLAVLKEARVAAYNWGFVDGKSQTIYPWDSWQKPYAAEPAVWFHDIFRRDGTPYRTAEVDYIRRVTGAKP